MQSYANMFFNVLNYKLEPHSLCITIEKPNSSLSMQGHWTASYLTFLYSHKIIDQFELQI